MNKPTLYVAIGAPGSGKSTYFHTKFSKCEDAIRISRDDIRYRLLRPGDYYFQHEKTVFNEFCREIQFALDRCDKVYADATHLDRNARKKLFGKLNLKGVTVTAINFRIPLETCLERNSKRNGIARVADSVVKELYGRLEYAEMGEEPFKAFIEVKE